MCEPRRVYYEKLKTSFFLHHDGSGNLDPDHEPDRRSRFEEEMFYYTEMPYKASLGSLHDTPWYHAVVGGAHMWREWMRFKRKENIKFATATRYIGYYDLKTSIPDFVSHSVHYFVNMSSFRYIFMLSATRALIEETRKGGHPVAVRQAALWFARYCFHSLHFWRNVPPVWTIFDKSENSWAQAGCCFALRSFCASTLQSIVVVQRAFKRRKAARTIQRWWNDMFYNPHYGVFVSRVGKARFKELARSVSA